MSININFYIAQDPETLNDISSSKFVGDIPIQQIKDSMSKGELKVFKEMFKNDKSDSTRQIVFITKDKTLNLSSEIYSKCKSKKWDAKMIFKHFEDSKADLNGVINVFPPSRFNIMIFIGIVLFFASLILGLFYWIGVSGIPADKSLIDFNIQNVKIDDYVEVKKSIFVEVRVVGFTKNSVMMKSDKTFYNESYFLMMDSSGDTYAVKFPSGSKVAGKIYNDSKTELDLISNETFKGIVRDISKFPKVADSKLDAEFEKDIKLLNLQTNDNLGLKNPKYLIDTTVEPTTGVYKYSVLLGFISLLVFSIVFTIGTIRKNDKYLENLLINNLNR